MAPDASPTGRARFIMERGVRILLLDFARIADVADALSAIAEARTFIARQPEDSLYVLTDVEGARYNPEVVEGMKDLATHNRPYVRASALIGLAPLQRIIYRMVLTFSKREIAVFESREEALHWLVEQARAKG